MLMTAVLYSLYRTCTTVATVQMLGLTIESDYCTIRRQMARCKSIPFPSPYGGRPQLAFGRHTASLPRKTAPPYCLHAASPAAMLFLQRLIQLLLLQLELETVEVDAAPSRQRDGEWNQSVFSVVEQREA